MTIMAAKLPWVEANQVLLRAEFARLKQRLGVPDHVTAPNPPEAMELFDGTTPAIDQLCEIFSLTGSERAA